MYLSSRQNKRRDFGQSQRLEKQLKCPLLPKAIYTLGEDSAGLCLVCTLLVCEDEGGLYSTDAFLATEKGNAPSKRRTVEGTTWEGLTGLCGSVNRRVAGLPGLSDI